MKTLKQLILIIVLASLTFACSSDDDNSSAQTVKQMLMSGKWYLEKVDENDVTPCEKTTFIHFYDENNFSYARYYSFNDIDCVIVDSKSGAFELINDTIIKVIYSETSETVEYEIISISNSEFILRMDDNHVYNFDKTEG
ncbi:lipocalin family protein [Mesonia sp. HuA40]|uniref:lipocalin family protein n=1 Tax=Mesonia sp. HuA40 TaxID=2602761 RepID=UPI0011CADBD9|nr:lipocalin family protein [Mesonia sp. HuA40]TXK72106.1 lipocalin family protein [Mesonia sp. HuA40]